MVLSIPNPHTSDSQVLHQAVSHLDALYDLLLGAGGQREQRCEVGIQCCHHFDESTLVGRQCNPSLSVSGCIALGRQFCF